MHVCQHPGTGWTLRGQLLEGHEAHHLRFVPPRAENGKHSQGVRQGTGSAIFREPSGSDTGGFGQLQGVSSEQGEQNTQGPSFHV